MIIQKYFSVRFYSQVRVTFNDKIRHNATMTSDKSTATKFIDDAIYLLQGILTPKSAVTDAVKKLAAVSPN